VKHSASKWCKEDAHAGKRLAIDLSALAALLRQSLVQAPGQAGNAQDGREMTEQ
jgi:hypothetical protein